VNSSRHTPHRYGATLEEWSAIAQLAREDTMPYVADPTVTINPRSKLQSTFKAPSQVYSDGMAGGIIGWTTKRVTGANTQQWRKHPAHGVGMVNRTYRTIDIDVADRQTAEEIVGAIRVFLGIPGLLAPVRKRANSGKRAMLFRITDPPEGGLAKHRLDVLPSIEPDLLNDGGCIEFLFDAQFTALAGTHASGARYEWEDGILPTKDNVPAITMAELRALVKELAYQFGDDTQPEWEPRPPRQRATPAAPGVNISAAQADPAAVWLVEKGLVEEVDPRTGGYVVRCPWEHEHTTPSNYGDTMYFPAGTNGIDHPGFRCLHAHCAHRDHEDYLNEVGYTASLFPDKEENAGIIAQPAPHAPKAQHVDPRPPMTTDKQGRIESTLDNVCRALTNPGWFGIDVAYDDFREAMLWGKVETDADGQRHTRWQAFSDETYTEITLRCIQRGFRNTTSSKLVAEAVQFVAKRNRIDTAKEWLDDLKWDGVSRIDKFHTEVLKLDDTDYHRAVSAYMWTALAGRVLEPGVKADMVPVLSGRQGQRKSTLVEMLVPTYNEAAEISMEKRDSDLARSLRGKMVASWNELRGLGTREEESIKGWLTQRVDEWVPKFKEFQTTRKRRFIVIGTTNKRRYLTDPTGSRRFLPLQIGDNTINTEWLEENRDQLWAEAAVRFRKSGVAYRDADRLAVHARTDAQVLEVWTPRIAAWLAKTPMKELSEIDILYHGVGLQPQTLNRSHSDRIRRAMQQIGTWTETPQGTWVFELG